MLSIVTINYNGTEKTKKLLESLAGQTDKDFEIIVVDNASEEPDFQKLNSEILGLRSLSIKLIKNFENLGFSGGCNTGIKETLKTGSEWVVLLNNDAWVENDFVTRLKANLSGLAGIAGIPLIEDGKTAYAGKIEWLKPTLSHIYKPDPLLLTTNYYVIGGGMVIYKNVFDKIGFFNEKYFLYFEDADFSLRALKAGFPVTILKEPKAHHGVSATTSKLGSPLLLRYHYRNALYFNLKNGPHYLKAVLWLWRLSIMTKQLIKIALNKNRRESLAILNGVFDYYKRRYGKIQA